MLQYYIDNALIPMVKALETIDNLIVWEIINEPEWIVETYQAATWQELQRFVGLIAAAL